MTKLNIKVVPGASRSEVAGWLGEALKVRVAAPPESGKANLAVEKVLAAALGVSRRQVRLEAGLASQRKVVAIGGLSQEEVFSRLGKGAA